MTTHVYIDGFNLYFGCLKGTPHRWLDLQAFSERLLPHDKVAKVRYFTALISARPNDLGGPVRQQVYLRALVTRPQDRGPSWVLLGEPRANASGKGPGERTRQRRGH